VGSLFCTPFSPCTETRTTTHSRAAAECAVVRSPSQQRCRAPHHTAFHTPHHPETMAACISLPQPNGYALIALRFLSRPSTQHMPNGLAYANQRVAISSLFSAQDEFISIHCVGCVLATLQYSFPIPKTFFKGLLDRDCLAPSPLLCPNCLGLLCLAPSPLICPNCLALSCPFPTPLPQWSCPVLLPDRPRDT
jgi:hypothetical protein